MLLVKTYLDKSRIHGLGAFAAEPIAKGTKVWTFVEGFDRAYSSAQFAKLPKPAQDFIRHYGYKVDGEIIFTVDNDSRVNHSDNPNTEYKDGFMIASRNIKKGEEITNDYRLLDPEFCAGFLKKKPKRKK
ncbi:MAG TPA: SET domain-containing protein [Alphaproteobacteria bacterium]|nr:SET domain-containing protein [Alphaproteobacteria bacterium]